MNLHQPLVPGRVEVHCTKAKAQWSHHYCDVLEDFHCPRHLEVRLCIEGEWLPAAPQK